MDTMQNFWNIKLKNGKSIGIGKGDYPRAEVNAAIQRITDFCATAHITMESQGGGFGSLTIKINGYEKTHGYDPYGIDIKMMLGYIDEALNFTATANSSFGPK